MFLRLLNLIIEGVFDEEIVKFCVYKFKIEIF